VWRSYREAEWRVGIESPPRQENSRSRHCAIGDEVPGKRRRGMCATGVGMWGARLQRPFRCALEPVSVQRSPGSFVTGTDWNGLESVGSSLEVSEGLWHTQGCFQGFLFQFF
jgi:hypothetical protein